MVSSGLATYRSPRVLASLLLYQQPSSTTLYYSYLGILTLIKDRLRNETWGNYRHINKIKPRSSEQGVWSPQTWRRTSHHVQLLSSCYINSLRQPYRPALTHYHPLSHQRVSFVLRLRQSFPEDCARLKLSSARASQAGLKEMMTRRRVRD